MTEGRFSDLATAIVARREADARDAKWLKSLAARLREAHPPLGMDHEAVHLDGVADRLCTSIDEVSDRADDLLHETQPMSLQAIANLNAGQITIALDLSVLERLVAAADRAGVPVAELASIAVLRALDQSLVG